MVERQDGDPRDDRELLARAKRGDRAAFEVVYRRHRDWIVRAAERILGDGDAALDVLQETFVYLLRKLPSLELTARLSTFLFPVVQHLAIAVKKRGARSESLEHEPVADPDEAVSELAEVTAGLSPILREVVLLRYVDDLPLQTIADRLAVPLGTVKSRLHQAMAVLREDPRTRRWFDPG